MPTKKQKKDSQVLSKKADVIAQSAKATKKSVFKMLTDMINFLKKIIVQFGVATKQFFTNLVRSAIGLPSKLRSLPGRFKSWRLQDKKKKKYRSFRLQKRIKPDPRYVPSSKELFVQSLSLIRKNFRLFFGIALIHGALYALLVKTTATVDIGSLQNSVKEVFGSSANSVSGTAALIGTVLGSPRKVEGGGFAVTFLVITTSLVYIWAIRERINNVTIRVRDAVFNGLGPLASTFVILLFMGLQLIPFGIATFFYTSARSNSLFASGFEDLFFFMITFLSGLASFYFLTSSIIALYASALPGVYPLRALKAAKELVAFRRLSVFRRLMSLSVMIVLTYLLLLIVVIRFIPDRTYAYIDVFQIAIVPFVNVYLYKLYRSLL